MSRSARSSSGGAPANRARPDWPPGVLRVPADELRWTCDPALLQGALAEEAEEAEAERALLEERFPEEAARTRFERGRRLHDQPAVRLEEVVGQERAVEALVSGIEIEAPGFHVFVSGPAGSGRTSLIHAALDRAQPPFPRPRDRVYVANFQHPERPVLLTLPRGKGRRFRRDLDEMLASLRREIPYALAHEHHLHRVERVRRRTETSACKPIDDLAAELRRSGLVVGAITEGYAIAELKLETGVEGQEPLPRSVVEKRLEQRRLKRTRVLTRALKAYDEGLERLEAATEEARAIARQGNRALRRLDEQLARTVAEGYAADLARSYPTDAVRRWLADLVVEIGRRVELFDAREEEEEERPQSRFEGLAPFRANLFVDAKEHPVPPRIVEPNPTFANLFGALDTSENIPEHMRLRAGSLLHANNGVMVVHGGALFQDRAAWSALKQTVRSGWFEAHRGGPVPGGSLRARPIRAAFKLIVIGDDEMFEAMHAYDPEFAAVFKVKVQLEEACPRSPESVHQLGRGLLRAARRCGLRPLDAGALARLIEESARRAMRHDRLHLGFARLLDLAQEADRVAGAGRKKELIRAQDVEEAAARRRRRLDLGERQAQQLLDDELVLLDLEGARVGVANAMVVYDETGLVFSRPTRLSASVGLGRAGVFDIERAAGFSGDSHKKGVEIVAGLLRERYAQDKPLCLTAGVAFEQSYAPVDGDSASLAEVLTILSALSDLPLDQGFGISGSINQKGEVQAVGDVNPKIEGFFDACLAKGLTGRQGVVIPEANLKDLMLRPDIAKAVAKGRFHVAAVRWLDDAAELLLGAAIGERGSPFDPYPEESINGRVDARLLAYADAARRFRTE